MIEHMTPFKHCIVMELVALTLRKTLQVRSRVLALVVLVPHLKDPSKELCWWRRSWPKPGC